MAQPAADQVHARIVGADVAGMPSTTQLATALDVELKTTIALVAATAICPALCIEIAFDAAGKSVFVRVVGTRGETRERRLLLPDDAAQWLQATVLLAGNLVRDEAAALIAGLASPAPTPPAVAEPGPPAQSSAPGALSPVDAAAMPPAPTLELGLAASVPTAPHSSDHSPFSIGLVPPLSMDYGRTGKRSHDVSLDLLVGVSGGSRALSISGLLDYERGDVDGLQLAGLAARADKHHAAVQVAGLGTLARTATVQVAGLFSIADQSAGWQISGVGNMARYAGLQLAGGGNYAWSADIQIAGVSNASWIGSPKLQLAGWVNGTAIVRGVQIASFNVADKVEGLQLGAVNIAVKSNSGVQIGVINIAGRDDDGVSIGAINFVPGGRTEIEAAFDSDQTGAIIIRHGSRKWHNIYGVAGNRGTDETTSTQDDQIWMYGVGMGRGARLGAGQLDVELMTWHVGHGTSFSGQLSLLPQLRVTYAHRFASVALIGGVVGNVYISDDGTDSSFSIGRGTYLSRGDGDIVRVRAWPSAFLGLRF
ncbi:MAG: hypothetical protein IPL79_13310 [Myxococcales bacterium]|nr:hypothetical protein [Myxococcales bacterium]